MKTAPKPLEKPAIREHWSTAPALVKNRIESLFSDAQNARIDSPTLVRGCFTFGYDMRRDEIPTPVMNAIAAGVSQFEINQRFGSMREQSERLEAVNHCNSCCRPERDSLTFDRKESQ